MRRSLQFSDNIIFFLFRSIFHVFIVSQYCVLYRAADPIPIPLKSYQATIPSVEKSEGVVSALVFAYTLVHTWLNVRGGLKNFVSLTIQKLITKYS